MIIEDRDHQEVIDVLISEVERVFPDSFGSDESYMWLLENYGITEEEDVRWQFIIDEESASELNPNDENDLELIAFLNDPEALWSFLEGASRRVCNCDELPVAA